jgi:hypothetical protein
MCIRISRIDNNSSSSSYVRDMISLSLSLYLSISHPSQQSIFEFPRFSPCWIGDDVCSYVGDHRIVYDLVLYVTMIYENSRVYMCIRISRIDNNSSSSSYVRDMISLSLSLSISPLSTIDF